MPVEKLTRNKKGSTCKPCRQLKLKCDSAEKYPEPCSRCTASGKLSDCIVDPEFRRVTNKQLVAELQSEIGRLRRELAQRKAVTPTSESGGNGAAPADLHLGSATPIAEATPSSYDPIHGIEGQMIDNVHLSPYNVRLLIAEYFKSFHPYFPILPDMPIFLASYDKNPLLMWTVLAIASSKQSTGLSSVYPLLVEPVRSMATELYDARSRSLETVQALLLLCMWPFPFQMAVNDPSMMYSGVAVQVSYQIGLHRPGYAQEFHYADCTLDKEHLLSRRKTWLGCFIASQVMALKMGVPSTISPGHSILSETAIAQNSDLPKTLLASAHILYHSHKAVSILGDDATAIDGQFQNPGPLLRSFDRDLHLIREQYAADWTDNLEMLYYDIFLQVSSFELVKNKDGDTFVEPDHSLFAKAVNAILAMVNITTNRTNESKSWPMMIKYCLLFAICLAIKLACQKSRDDEVRLSLLDAATRANYILRSWSFFPRDSFGRLSSYFETILLQIDQEAQLHAQHARLGDMVTSSDSDGYTGALKYGTKVRSRMATSVVYDIMWTAKEIIRKTKAHTVDSAPGIGASNTSSSVGLNHSQTTVLSPSFNDYTFIPEFQYPEGLDIWMDWQTMTKSAFESA